MTKPLTFLNLLKRPLFIPLLLVMGIILWRDVIHNTLPPPLPQKHTFHGVIKEQPELKNEKIKMGVALEEGQVLIHGPSIMGELNKGDEIEFSGRLKEPLVFHNPGVFDYGRFLQRHGIYWVAYLHDLAEIKVLKKGWTSGWQETKKKFQKKIVRRFPSFFSSEAKGVLMALLWGDEGGLSKETTRLFRNQGLAHLLVISGLHFAVVAFLLFQFFVRLGWIFPKIYLYLPCRKIAALMTFVFLTIYYFFCVSNPSITRAYVAVGCYLMALILGRSKDVLNILFLAALVILVVEPASLFEASFQFSFVAVLSLLLVYPKLENYLSVFSRYLPKPVWNLVLVQLAIFIGLGPLLVFYFHEIQQNGFFMNLWAVPVIELALVPVGLVGIASFFFSPWFSKILFSLDLFFIEGILRILQTADSYLGEPWLVFPPHGWELALYYGIVGILILEIPDRLKKSLLLIGFIAAWANLGYWIHEIFFRDRLSITQVDVGQGDAVFVELPRKKRVLIDGGGSGFRVGEQALIPFLLYERIPCLDVVVVTHSDTDHYRGLIPVLERYKVGQLWWNGISKNDLGYRELFLKAAEKKIDVRPMQAGDEYLLGEGRWRVLSPDRAKAIFSKDNNQSLVLQLLVFGKKALFTGDIELPVERALVEQWGSALKSDYLKVAHHGSRTSSDEEFLKQVSPLVATLGAQKKNRFHHPHEDVALRFQRLGIPLYRTDLHGAIKVNLDSRLPRVHVYGID